MKCQQYETKTKIITSRVNEHNCLRRRALERKGRGSGMEREKVKKKDRKRRRLLQRTS